MKTVRRALRSLLKGIGARLSLKINLVVVVCMVMLMLIPAILLAQTYRQRHLESVRRDAERMVELFAELSQDQLARQAYGMLYYNAKSLMGKENVRFVNIYDTQGVNLLPFTGKGSLPDDSVHVVSRDVVARHIESGFVGRVVVGVDLAPAEAEVDRMFALLLLGIFGSGGILVLTLTHMLQRFVVRPVNTLEESVRTIATGDLEHRIAETGHDELGRLASNINIMTANLNMSMRARRQAEAGLEKLNRELEEKVRERTERLSEKAVELEKANERLQGLDRVKSSLLSQVSHELRTPLTSILGFTKVIHRDFDRLFMPLAREDGTLSHKGERIVSNLEIIENEGDRLTRLINDLLDLNKIESGHMEWRDRVVDFSECVEQAVRSCYGAFTAKADVQLEWEVEDELPAVFVDPDRMDQLLTNLIGNAAKFTHSGSVSVTARRCDEGWIEVSVADTGVGIRSEDLDRIFRKFTQVGQENCETTRVRGTGLGLAICREIVERYGGSLRVESEYGKGSAFIFTLPVYGPDFRKTGEPLLD
ncbi:HAMP domain-containing sensor histidine kinase [Desulfovibrio oxyclinae]|uniref:HAMP domain-containing sensor histidine kinase n=1 Tax=Desulfovibrio oxyclinae TaxID=63560 RepID=UPI0006848BAE|nr:ATP-binding protein [Desulfovibrio oxyclinae]